MARLDMERTPLPSQTPSTGKPSVPHVDIDRFAIDVVQLGAALAGRPTTLSLAGNGRMISLEDARIDVQAHRIDRDGSGDYALNLRFDSKRMDGRVRGERKPACGASRSGEHADGCAGMPALGNMFLSHAKTDARAYLVTSNRSGEEFTPS